MYHVKLRTSVGIMLDTIESVYIEEEKDNELGVSGLRLMPVTGSDFLVVFRDSAEVLQQQYLQELYVNEKCDFSAFASIMMNEDDDYRVLDNDEVDFLHSEYGTRVGVRERRGLESPNLF